MRFPCRLLPSPFYKHIAGELGGHHVVRFTSNSDILDQASGFIKQECICSPSDQVADLSTNLLSIFRLRDLYIELTKAGKELYGEYCDADTKVKRPEYGTHFSLNEERSYWVLPIQSVHNTQVDYTKNNLPFKATCTVMHSPMLWNFWHFSIRWRTDDGLWNELDDRAKRKLGTRLSHVARSHIAINARVEKDVRTLPLPPNRYLKKSFSAHLFYILHWIKFGWSKMVG